MKYEFSPESVFRVIESVITVANSGLSRAITHLTNKLNKCDSPLAILALLESPIIIMHFYCTPHMTNLSQENVLDIFVERYLVNPLVCNNLTCLI